RQYQRLWGWRRIANRAAGNQTDPKPRRGRECIVAMAAISIAGVTKAFPGVVALEDVSLDIEPGELHSICGENGAGKSTSMKILSGVITDYQGQRLIQGRSVHFRNTRDAEAAGISVI